MTRSIGHIMPSAGSGFQCVPAGGSRSAVVRDVERCMHLRGEQLHHGDQACNAARRQSQECSLSIDDFAQVQLCQNLEVLSMKPKGAIEQESSDLVR